MQAQFRSLASGFPCKISEFEWLQRCHGPDTGREHRELLSANQHGARENLSVCKLSFGVSLVVSRARSLSLSCCSAATGPIRAVSTASSSVLTNMVHVRTSVRNFLLSVRRLTARARRRQRSFSERYKKRTCLNVFSFSFFVFPFAIVTCCIG